MKESFKASGGTRVQIADQKCDRASENKHKSFVLEAYARVVVRANAYLHAVNELLWVLSTPIGKEKPLLPLTRCGEHQKYRKRAPGDPGGDESK